MTHLGDVITTTTGQPADLYTPIPYSRWHALLSCLTLRLSLFLSLLGSDAWHCHFGIKAQAKWAHKKDKEIIFTLNTRASCHDKREDQD